MSAEKTSSPTILGSLTERFKSIQKDGLRTSFQSATRISSHSYFEVSENDELDTTDDDIQDYLAAYRPKSYSPSRIKWILWGSISTTLVAALAVSGLVYAGTRPKLAEESSNNGRECGRSAEEAREKSCRFEPMLSAWIPDACHFPEFISEYKEALGDMHTDWPWWWDRNLTVRVTGAEIPLMQAGNYSAIYTDYDHSHGLHCLYCWRKLTHAIEHGYKMIDNRCHQFYHAKHCAQHIAERMLKPHTGREKWSYPLMYHDCVAITSTHQTKPPE